MSFFERLIGRIPKDALEQEDEKPEWVSPAFTLARHIPADTKLLVVHPKSKNLFWLKVEDMVTNKGDVNIVGRKPGILNSERISIAGNTKVKTVDKIKIFEED